ncbi:Cupredoxin [Xylogone sp. PMI_703]|nr:Cupredoxin [Xylogone sp. PMI_703]
MIVRLSLCAIIIQYPYTILANSNKRWISPVYNYFFQFPLPIPPDIKPLASYIDSNTSTPIDFFQLNISTFEAQIYPNLEKTDLVGYNGVSPGPTFRIQRGRQSVVRVVNQNDRPAVLHLHGSYTRAVWDGWAEDLIQPGQYKDYYFPNSNTARTLWYHDHAVGNTSINAYSGLAGFYIIRDPDVENQLGLPEGQYDVLLALSAKQYTSTGKLTSVGDETDSVYGDIIEVNGQPWPFLMVEPRKYRFRILNTALSRTFILGVSDGSSGTNIPFQVIASDSGFMSSPVTTTALTVAMAERWEVIVDFSNYSNQNLTLNNQRKVFDAADYEGTDRVMQFNVGSMASSNANNSEVPTSLVTLDTPPSGTQIHRTFKFNKKSDMWLINGVPFNDVKNRVLADPQKGNTEIWLLENQSGYWSHPIHIHMVDFQIISRSKGRNMVEPYEKVALKDVAVLGPGESVTVAVTFAPFAGLYMFHCHNLIHEDHAMMDAFNVTDIQGLGYDASDMNFADPMEPQWRAKNFTAADTQSILNDVLPQFAATNAYQNVSVREAQIQGSTSDST